MWKPFNGLQNYNPTAWTDSIEDASIFDSPPAKCKKGGAPIRINCDDDGNFNGPPPGNGTANVEGTEHLKVLAWSIVIV